METIDGEEYREVFDGVSELSDRPDDLGKSDFYAGIFGKFMVVCTNDFFDLLLLVTPRLKPPEKHKNLLPACWTIDLSIDICLKVVYDALT